jgi:hypothetical protein
MQIYKDGIVADYKRIFKNISFPSSGPSEEFLQQNNAYKINLFIDHNRATQKLVSCEPYIKDGWAYTVKVENKTEEDIASDLASKSAQKRAERDQALAASDWTQVLDAPVDRTVWAAYRQALRDLPEQEGFPWIDLPASP